MSGCVSGWRTHRSENYPVCIIYDKIRYDIKNQKYIKIRIIYLLLLGLWKCLNRLFLAVYSLKNVHKGLLLNFGEMWKLFFSLIFVWNKLKFVELKLMNCLQICGIGNFSLSTFKNVWIVECRKLLN